MPRSLTKEWLDKPTALNEALNIYWDSRTGCTLLSGALGTFGWHLLGNDSIMTFQSTYTEALVPSVNYSASDSLVDIFSGMAFNHAKTPVSANKAAS